MPDQGDTEGEYVLHLKPEPGYRAPVPVRLRHGLKLLLRTCGLRCVRVRLPDDAELGDGKQKTTK